MRVRVRRTSWHTVQAQHRALATIGKLAAEHARPERSQPERSSRSAVRVVRDAESEHAPGAPPVLRSRPRHALSTDTKDPEHSATSAARVPIANGLPAAAFLPGPSVKLVRQQNLEPLAGAEPHTPAIPRPVLPTIPAKKPADSTDQMLRFDALAESGPRKADENPRSQRPQRASRIHLDMRRGLERFGAVSTRTGQVGEALLTGFRTRALKRWSGALRGGRTPFVEVGRRPRAAIGAAAAALVFVALIGLAVAGTGGGAPHHQTASGGRSAISPAPGSPSLSQGAGTEQAPQASASLLEMTSSTSAVYQVSGPISVVLHATAPCWIEARRSGPNGGLLFQGTLVPGQAWTVAGPTWLRLGNPTAVSLAINGQQVSPPAAQGIPFDLQIG